MIESRRPFVKNDQNRRILSTYYRPLHYTVLQNNCYRIVFHPCLNFFI